MPPRTTPRLCAGALLLLLAGLGGLAFGEISSDFSPCLRFFFNRVPPKGLGTAGCQPICQRYHNQYRFASLYHRQHRTPLYSAYILGPAAGKRPKTPWMYEPQLAFSGASADMRPFRRRVDQNVIDSQAVLLDYRKSSYTKGHLNPSMHQRTRDDHRATFTLANVVPQRAGSNNGPWSVLESEVLRRFKAFCNGTMHVLTGTLPYASGAHWLNNRVSVPEYMWSAYCCPSYSASLPESLRPFFPTHAAVGRNDRSSGEEIVPVDVTVRPSVRGYDVRRMPLEMLEGVLAQRLATPIDLFPGQCQ